MRRESNPSDQNDELLRLITANKTRLAKLKKTIVELQIRTKTAGEAAHLWEKSPDRETVLPAEPKLPENPRH